MAQRRHARAWLIDIWRTVIKNPKRFISMFIITALGATMLVGLRAACEDLRQTADRFFDEQHLYDIAIHSTLGFTADDIDAMSQVKNVELAVGSYTERVYTRVGTTTEKLDVSALNGANMNQPRVLEGRLPRSAFEVAITPRYQEAAGVKLGERVSFFSPSDQQQVMRTGDGEGSATVEDAGEKTAVKLDDPAAPRAIFARTNYTVVGVVRDPMDINPDSASMGFRTRSATKYRFFLTPEAVLKPEVFTVAYVHVRGAHVLNTYSDAYTSLIGQAKSALEKIRYAREQTRSEDVRTEARARIEKEQTRANKQLDDAAAQLLRAQTQLRASAQELSEGRQQLSLQSALAGSQIHAAQDELAEQTRALKAAELQLQEKESQLARGQSELKQGYQAFERKKAKAYEETQERVSAQFAAHYAELDDQERQLQGTIETLASQIEDISAGFIQAGVTWPDTAWRSLTSPYALAHPSQGDEARAAFSEALAEAIQTAYPRLEGDIAGLRATREELEQRLAEVRAHREQLGNQTPPPSDDALAELDAQIEAIEQQRSMVAARIQSLESLLAPTTQERVAELARAWQQAHGGLAKLAHGRQQVQEQERSAQECARLQLEKQLDSSAAELQARSTELAMVQQQLTSARALLEQNRRALAAGALTLASEQASAQQALSKAAERLARGEARYVLGERDYQAGLATYEANKATAAHTFQDAYRRLDKIENAVWYIQDRTALPSFTSVDSDAQSIESIATVFPILFFVVAILMSLTTITRMVVEDRGLIGIYKALGYGRLIIMAKYLVYALTACIAGGILGDILGFVVMPEVLFIIFRTMYALTDFELHMSALTAVFGIIFFVAGMLGATLVACAHASAEEAASLMRPRAPRAGARILLERVRPLWSRLSFLNKVTARNVFRYKKRALMTIIGIAGCTALMICGLGIKDTVVSLRERQYGDAGLVHYDLLAVAAPSDIDAAASALDATGAVIQKLPVYVDSVTASYQGRRESIQLMVVPEPADLAPFVDVLAQDGRAISVPTAGAKAVLTKNAEQVLGFHAGSDTVGLQDQSLAEAQVQVTDVALNYLGNVAYMSEASYRAAFGKDATPNAYLVQLRSTAAEQISLADTLGLNPVFITLSSVARISTQFQETFMIIDVVVYLVTVMAAALAFAVVFALSTTNISERARELATIKVLGFRPREMHRYINKETVILALIGMLAGCPLGYGITRLLTIVLHMPSLYFDTVVDPRTYLIASGASLVFVLLVNRITNRSLDNIVMVEALKSAE
ncbi:FtsX-like permease family protein [Collinsella sp. zg1085]|uniref:FtsX-like permease family protein n=1 Tax=Collinsella sp. zg1085 TaxID=2844380 RepID=UPI001C0BD81D|nr:FtsX-like permease family protein [Collinsella sp. zg1085]QWT17837.1 FtsX-like permease family protein [Collinsella sp. zg1085]